MDIIEEYRNKWKQWEYNNTVKPKKDNNETNRK